jgi:hypothetical protein
MLLTLFTLGALGVSATRAGIEDMHFREKTYTLPNGQRYWMDRLGRCRLCSNDKLIFGDCTGRWYDDKHRLICDKKAIERQNQRTQAIKENRLSYDCYTDRTGGHRANVEVSTGKVIARMQRRKLKDGSYECRKWYLYDIYAIKYPDDSMCMTVRPDNYNWEDKGIVISESEFERLLPVYSSVTMKLVDEKTNRNRY